MLNIRIDRVTNKVLEKIIEGRLLWKIIIRRQKSTNIDHIILCRGLLKLVIEESVERKNHKERPKTLLFDIQQIIKDQSSTLNEKEIGKKK